MINNQTAIILHGVFEAENRDYFENGERIKNSPSNSHWMPWLQKELLFKGIFTQTPELPTPWVPDVNYSKWENTIKRFETPDIFIGHSAGGGFLLKYLSLNKNIKIKRLVLVAPWLDLEKDCTSFLQNFELDKELSNRVEKIDLFYSTDDGDYILKSIERIKHVYPNITIHKFSDKGHFCEGCLKSKEFLELLEIF